MSARRQHSDRRPRLDAIALDEGERERTAQMQRMYEKRKRKLLFAVSDEDPNKTDPGTPCALSVMLADEPRCNVVPKLPDKGLVRRANHPPIRCDTCGIAEREVHVGRRIRLTERLDEGQP